MTLRAASGDTRWLARYDYDDRGNLTAVTNHYGPSFRYTYDAAGRFAAYEDGIKVRNAYAYDDRDRVVRVTTAGGLFDHAIAYEAEGRATTLTYEADRADATRYEFDDNGRVVQETDPLGYVRLFDRNALGTLLAESDAEGNRTRYRHDAFGNRAAMIDPEGRQMAYRYDADGRLGGVVDAMGHAWVWGYDERGNLSWARDPLGHRTDYAVDAAGQLTGTMRHDGLIETRSYDDRHLLARVVDFRGGTTSFARDGFGRVVAITDPLGQVTRLGYVERDGADFWTPSTLTRPDGVTTSREVDLGEARVTTVDGEGRRTVRRYGPFDLLEEVESPGGGRLRFAYDHRQRLVRVENQLGRQWTFERDAAGRVIRDPLEYLGS